MVDRPTSGKLLGVPYNFERPSIRRVVSAYWQPGEGMLVEKPFGIGFTLNLANWRSWVVLGVVAALLWHEHASANGPDPTGDDEEPVDVVVD